MGSLIVSLSTSVLASEEMAQLLHSHVHAKYVTQKHGTWREAGNLISFNLSAIALYLYSSAREADKVRLEVSGLRAR